MDRCDVSSDSKPDRLRRGSHKKRRASKMIIAETSIPLPRLSLPCVQPLTFSLSPLSPSATFVFGMTSSPPHCLAPPALSPRLVAAGSPPTRRSLIRRPGLPTYQQHRPPIIPSSSTSLLLPPFSSLALHARSAPLSDRTRRLPAVDALGPLERCKKRKIAHRCIRSALLLAGPLGLVLPLRSESMSLESVPRPTSDKRPVYRYKAGPTHDRQPVWLSTSAAADGRSSCLCPREAIFVGLGTPWLRAISRKESRKDIFPTIRLPKPPLVCYKAAEAVNTAGSSTQQVPLKGQLLAVLRMRASAGPGEAGIRFKKWVLWNAWMRRSMGYDYQQLQAYAPSLSATGRLISPPGVQVYDENGDLITGDEGQEYDLASAFDDDDSDLECLEDEEAGQDIGSQWRSTSPPPLTPCIDSSCSDNNSNDRRMNSSSHSPPTTPEETEEAQHQSTISTSLVKNELQSPLSPDSPPSLLDPSCIITSTATLVVRDHQVPILLAPRPKHGKSSSLSSRLEHIADDEMDVVDSVMAEQTVKRSHHTSHNDIVTKRHQQQQHHSLNHNHNNKNHYRHHNCSQEKAVDEAETEFPSKKESITTTTHQTPPTPPPSPPTEGSTAQVPAFVHCAA